MATRIINFKSLIKKLLFTLRDPMWGGIGVLIVVLFYWADHQIFDSSNVNPLYKSNEVINIGGLTYIKKFSGESYSWYQAKQYCDSLPTIGLNQWRLPEKNELETIVSNDIWLDANDVTLWTSTNIGDNNATMIWVIKLNELEWFQNPVDSWQHHVMCVTTGPL